MAVHSVITCSAISNGWQSGCFNSSIRPFPYCNCSFVSSSRSELNWVKLPSHDTVPGRYEYFRLPSSSPLSVRTTYTGYRQTYVYRRSHSGEETVTLQEDLTVCDEITLVGIYADTSPACVSIIGRAVMEPPPSFHSDDWNAPAVWNADRKHLLDMPHVPENAQATGTMHGKLLHAWTGHHKQ